MRSLQFSELRTFDVNTIERDVRIRWAKDDIVSFSLVNRKDAPNFVFYEGPPSANGMPGIHHVISRTMKDLFCRYKTMRGYRVERKAGWDTHGLPVELGVEKLLGIDKKDIGNKVSIKEFNQACRQQVLLYKEAWDDLTKRMGYWVDMQSPYITYENHYIETLWWILSKLYHKKLLYKSVTIQPYSPAAGTGLSAHELNQPGTYKNVKDVSITALFRISSSKNHPEWLKLEKGLSAYFMAWTTTPWTLPSNLALAVNLKERYVLIKTINPYTKKHIAVIMAQKRISAFFDASMQDALFDSYEEKHTPKHVPWHIISQFSGKDILGTSYEQLLPFSANQVDLKQYKPFQVISSDHVTTEDGTGVVHMAPAFGADDFKACKKNHIGFVCLVNKQGKFIEGVGDWSGRYVKNFKGTSDFEDVNVAIAIFLKKKGLAFLVEKYEHTYPHCWRTDKPILYYPLDAWFVKLSDHRDKLVELNKTINWRPESTGKKRFGNWLENAVDWNLSRTRFWGTPLPIWRTKENEEERCISSIKELTTAYLDAVKAGVMHDEFELSEDGVLCIDLHRPEIDKIVLVSSSGKPMYRELDLVDVWFDSGAMPYAQWHYPFENKEKFEQQFPADFICEGVDQTRGWFYTLHILSTLLFDSVAYKNVISNGLVLDKEGNKMSKRLGNVVDPNRIMEKYGADATRWYLVTSASPWDNISFDENGLGDVKSKLFATLYNTYQFFTIYANLDGFVYAEQTIPIDERQELDQWLISCLHSLIKTYKEQMDEYEPMHANRAIYEFVDEKLSNWYVRLSRRRFWKDSYSKDKIAAFQTLYEVLEGVAYLMAPLAPFFSDWLFCKLNDVTKKEAFGSVHHSLLPSLNEKFIDDFLEKKIEFARRVCSLAFSIRQKEKIKVRQPLRKLIVDDSHAYFGEYLKATSEIIKQEVNVKEIVQMSAHQSIVSKKLKPRFEILGKRMGSQMKEVSQLITNADKAMIDKIEKNGYLHLQLANGEVSQIHFDEVQVLTDYVKGWSTATKGTLIVSLDTEIYEPLLLEGYARELVNRVQNMRKHKGLELTNKICVRVYSESMDMRFIKQYNNYICREVLASSLAMSIDKLAENDAEVIEFGNHVLLVHLSTI